MGMIRRGLSERPGSAAECLDRRAIRRKYPQFGVGLLSRNPDHCTVLEPGFARCITGNLIATSQHFHSFFLALSRCSQRSLGVFQEPRLTLSNREFVRMRPKPSLGSRARSVHPLNQTKVARSLESNAIPLQNRTLIQT